DEWSPAQREFIERNRRRPGPILFDDVGYHYSWEWGGVRFVQLNLFPGTEPRPVYGSPAPGNDPKGSLAFLATVLERVDPGQPLVLVWHYGLRGWGLEQWWLEEDLEALAGTIRGYNVLLILHGHEHRFERYTWRGHDVIMAPSPQYDRDPDRPELDSRPRGFLVFRITEDELQMGYRTPDGWTARWSKPIRRPEAGAPASRSVSPGSAPAQPRNRRRARRPGAHPSAGTGSRSPRRPARP
ncbi:MAG: hypothetical protein ACOCUW_04215, partial [Gemmatimonadota bacterium]